MKKVLLAILISLTLGGCATDKFVRKEVVVEYKYIVRSASQAQKEKPKYPDTLDVANADQLSLATWIKQSEERQLRLEAIIDELIEFYEKPVDPQPAEVKVPEEKK